MESVDNTEHVRTFNVAHLIEKSAPEKTRYARRTANEAFWRFIKTIRVLNVVSDDTSIEPAKPTHKTAAVRTSLTNTSAILRRSKPLPPPRIQAKPYVSRDDDAGFGIVIDYNKYDHGRKDDLE